MYTSHDVDVISKQTHARPFAPILIEMPCALRLCVQIRCLLIRLRLICCFAVHNGLAYTWFGICESFAGYQRLSRDQLTSMCFNRHTKTICRSVSAAVMGVCYHAVLTAWIMLWNQNWLAQNADRKHLLRQLWKSYANLSFACTSMCKRLEAAVFFWHSRTQWRRQTIYVQMQFFINVY